MAVNTEGRNIYITLLLLLTGMFSR